MQRGLQQLAHVKHFLIDLFHFTVLPGFKFDGLIREQAEVLDQNMSGTFQRFFGMNGTVDEEMLHMRKLLKTPLHDLDLSVRAYNCLKAADVKTLGELVQLEISDMMSLQFSNQVT